VAQTLNSRARTKGKSRSGSRAVLVRAQVAGRWPADFFEEVVGGWKGRPLRRAKQGPLERRAKLA
jgi:hypothetical protein